MRTVCTGAMGVAESIALAGLGLSALGLGAAGVKALWTISATLGAFQARITQILDHHDTRLDDHEERLRKGRL